MHHRAAFALFLWLLPIGSCAPPRAPYEGLNRTSYGPLLATVPRSCDPNGEGQIADVSRDITAFIARPFSGANKVDRVIYRENLSQYFKFPGDPGMPPVDVLDSSDGDIVFWHVLELVSVPETSAAASAYCGHRQRQAAWEGSAAQCAAPQPTSLAINGQQVVVRSTYVISSYRCDDISHPRSRRRG